MKIKSLFISVLLLLGVCQAFGQKNVPHPIQVTFESSSLSHRVLYNNKYWMAIHVRFRIKNADETPLRLFAYFYNDDDGKPLKADPEYSAKYRTTSGQVMASVDFTPNLDDAVYKDFLIYIPYEAMNLDSTKGNEFSLKYYLSVYDPDEKAHVAKSGYYKFGLKY